jgi:hypothetical protein
LEKNFNHEAIAEHAQKFSTASFASNMKNLISDQLASR